MSGFLLDTNILAALSPNKIDNRNLRRWVADNFKEIYISVITIAEIEAGIAKLQRQGATQKAHLIKKWLETTLTDFSSNILDFDLQTARLTGLVRDKSIALGKNSGFADSALAATALKYNLKFVTLNIKDFDGLGINLEVLQQ